MGFDLTYEELKLGIPIHCVRWSAGFDLTYEELKRRCENRKHVSNVVLILPMRN